MYNCIKGCMERYYDGYFINNWYESDWVRTCKYECARSPKQMKEENFSRTMFNGEMITNMFFVK